MVFLTKENSMNISAYYLFFVSLELNQAWRFVHNFFYLDPLQGTFEISNLKFMWKDGIFSIALGKTESNGYKNAYFHSSCR